MDLTMCSLPAKLGMEQRCSGEVYLSSLKHGDLSIALQAWSYSYGHCIVVAIVAVSFPLSSLSSSRHGGRCLCHRRHGAMAMAIDVQHPR